MVSGQLPPSKITPRLGFVFVLELGLVLRLGTIFSYEKKTRPCGDEDEVFNYPLDKGCLLHSFITFSQSSIGDPKFG